MLEKSTAVQTRHIMVKKVITIKDSTVEEAVRLMNEHEIGYPSNLMLRSEMRQESCFKRTSKRCRLLVKVSYSA
jgi:CBS domain-containing protein